MPTNAQWPARRFEPGEVASDARIEAAHAAGALDEPDPQDTCPAWLAWLLRLADKPTPMQFYVGYGLGVLSCIVGFAVGARL